MSPACYRQSSPETCRAGDGFSRGPTLGFPRDSRREEAASLCLDTRIAETRIVNLVSRIDYLQRLALTDQDRCVEELETCVGELKSFEGYMSSAGMTSLFRDLQARTSLLLDIIAGGVSAQPPVEAAASPAAPPLPRLDESVARFLQLLSSRPFDAPAFVKLVCDRWQYPEERLEFARKYREETGVDLAMSIDVACERAPHTMTLMSLFADPVEVIREASEAIYLCFKEGETDAADMDKLALALVTLVASKQLDFSYKMSEYWRADGLPMFLLLKEELKDADEWQRDFLFWVSSRKTRRPLNAAGKTGIPKNKKEFLDLLTLKNSSDICRQLGLRVGEGGHTSSVSKRSLEAIDEAFEEVFPEPDGEPLRFAFYASLSFEFGLVRLLLQMLNHGGDRGKKDAGVLVALMFGTGQWPLRPVSSLGRKRFDTTRMADKREPTLAKSNDFLIQELDEALNPNKWTGGSKTLCLCIREILGTESGKR